MSVRTTCSIMVSALLLCISGYSQDNKQSRVYLSGSVIAWDGISGRFEVLNSEPSPVWLPLVLVIRLEENKNVPREQQYILIYYLSKDDSGSSYPKSFINGKTKWRFSVKRMDNCSMKLSDFQGIVEDKEGERRTTSRLMYMPDAETGEIPDNVIMPCYTLLKGDFKLHKE